MIRSRLLGSFVVASLLCLANVSLGAEPDPWKSVMETADRYMYGQGIPQDRGEAAKRYEKACAAGVQDACSELTEILYWGHPAVPKDQARATELMKSLLPYLKAACSKGNPRACLRLGAAFADGMGTEVDRARAADLDRMACDGGFIEGCFYLGVAYAKARGVKEDHARAAAMYRRSCEAGYAAGCTELSEAHRLGKGVDLDLQRSDALKQQACSLGMKSACGEK